MEYIFSAHCVHVPVVVLWYDPAGHVHKALPAVEVVLAGHWRHAVWLPSTENVPAAQLWHAVDAPSTKNCPAPQHTAVPVGAHLSELPAAHDPKQADGVDPNSLSSTMDIRLLMADWVIMIL